MVYQVNRSELEKMLEILYRKAEGWQPANGGECQLYGRYDENGLICKMWIETFAGHSSWVHGDNIVHIRTKSWFDVMEYEDMAEWLENELFGYPELQEAFFQYLKEEHGIEKPDIRDLRYYWYLFERFDPDKWEEFTEKWKETAIEKYMRDFIYDTIAILEEDGWYISDDVPATVPVE